MLTGLNIYFKTEHYPETEFPFLKNKLVAVAFSDNQQSSLCMMKVFVTDVGESDSLCIPNYAFHFRQMVFCFYHVKLVL